MAVEEGVLNLSEFVSMLPPAIVEGIGGLVIILKAIGIAVIVYVVYVVVMGVINLHNARRIRDIEKQVISIDKKLNILIKKKKKK